MSPSRTLTLFALVLAAALALGFDASRSADAKPNHGGGHRHGIYWGAQIGDQLTGEQAPWDMGAVYKFERLARKHISLLNFNAGFVTCESSKCVFNPFPLTPMENLRAHGVIPVFSWSSSSVSEGTHDPKFSLSKIIHGRYDGYIREFARSAAAWGHPFFLRFNWEMNGNWFPWSEGVNGNRRGQFVAAWRHVHDIFTSVGATNATWVWCPNVGGTQNMRTLYPGDKYVDWTCLDGYNWGTRFSWSHWLTFRQVFATSYAALRKLAPRKPIMLGEVASTDYGGSKAAWIKEMLSSIPRNFRKIRALIWFEVNDRGTHWPIESSRSVRNAFARGIRKPVYMGNDFGQIDARPIPAPRR
ncbi:MAG TPA: glycosyl hydrolase [Chloroflexota bacterium]|nr:glycosyl hydrolase [Chloroflexota bacterium]